MLNSIGRERIALLRRAMSDTGIDVAVVPSADPHLSEYLPERWKSRAWLSGFTGSMGGLVVARDRAALFADSRYWEQAEQELAGAGIDLVKVRSLSWEPYAMWIAEAVKSGGCVAIDAFTISAAGGAELVGFLQPRGIRLRTDLDLVDQIWRDRPGLPLAPIFAHAPPYAVRTRAETLSSVRAAMRDAGATHHVVSTLDDVAWITGLRGADIAYNPVFLAHLIVSHDAATLFVVPSKVDAPLRAALADDAVALADYAAFPAALAALPNDARVLVDPKRITLGIAEAIGARRIDRINPSVLLKSRKTPEEIALFRRAMIEDGAAMCRFYATFEAAYARGERWGECLVHERLTAERAKSPIFVSPSFETCAGFNANGALAHYAPRPETQATIDGDGLLLIDTGAQFLCGTTDTTRVWAIGVPSDAMRRDVTLALKGLIALTSARFPAGIPAPLLDSIARAPIWAEGINYSHGTGHGVGYFLSVHEGPHLLSGYTVDPSMALEDGMVTAIEPGVYRPGRWGARIENIAVTVAAPEAEHGRFLTFDTLTLCPIDRRCLDLTLLSATEIAWLDRYHEDVRRALGPHVSDAALAWLERQTAPIA